MEKETLKKIKKKLEAEKTRIEEELGNIAKKKGKKFTPVYPEYGSRDEENAAEVEEYEIHLALDKNLEKLLGNVIKSLAKIEQGTYGKCENCGLEISKERLEAFPSANFCITCQSKKDNLITKFFSRLRPHKNVRQPKDKKTRRQ
ncbi:MAG: TraR/DksA C4-type zinc finger protein [Patescibacteria group bacterium]|nr:TraR/DksA C4-type zinc finger protein [Patescibacteria group bacterium]